MSLSRAALRICTVRALRGATMVGDLVADSEQGPIDDTSHSLPIPGIAVYTDDSKFGAGQRDLFAGGEQALVIEYLITQRMKLEHKDNEDEVTFESPQTDAALELSLDIIERQIKVALVDPLSEWAELWRKFAPTIVGQSTSSRGASMREGVRFAGRQLVLMVDLAKDPTPGQPLGPNWTAFLAKVDETADLAPVAGLLRQVIEGTSPGPHWRALQAAYGLTLAEAEALGVAPPEAAQETSPTFADELGQVTELAP